MSSYFDALSREAAVAADGIDDDEAFFNEIVDIDRRLYEDVSAITGDREFPDDLRHAMLGAFAVHSVFQPGNVPVPKKARMRVLAYRGSRVVEAMHDLFHELARRRIQTRFGLLNDSPSYMLVLREDHDS
jgi:hypothetical protein